MVPTTRSATRAGPSGAPVERPGERRAEGCAAGRGARAVPTRRPLRDVARSRAGPVRASRADTAPPSSCLVTNRPRWAGPPERCVTLATPGHYRPTNGAVELHRSPAGAHPAPPAGGTRGGGIGHAPFERTRLGTRVAPPQPPGRRATNHPAALVLPRYRDRRTHRA